jgi:hypothetical protein
MANHARQIVRRASFGGWAWGLIYRPVVELDAVAAQERLFERIELAAGTVVADSVAHALTSKSLSISAASLFSGSAPRR